MNRLTLAGVRLLAAASLLFTGHSVPAQAAPASSGVCGVLASATWDTAGSPYVVCPAGATIPLAATITIDPGVTVEFSSGPGNKTLVVQGKLFANGSVTQTINFTSTTHTPGAWGGIYVIGTALNPAAASFNYANLNYGGIVTGSTSAELSADNAVLTVTNSLIANSGGDGIYVASTGRIDVHATSFVGNGERALELSQPTTDLLMTGLSASGNGTNGVYLSGNATWTGQHRVGNPGIPYVVEGPFGNNQGDVLTVEPGNTFLFTATGYLYVRGQFKALGTPSQPITFTGQTQTPGFWKGLFIDGGQHQAIAQLDYVTIEYGGNTLNGANIEVANGRLIVHHSIIRNSLHDGVRFASNWGGSILESQIIDNAGYGVRNGTPLKPVLATNNWWGDPLGPQSDVVACSTGAGSKVTAGVFFVPLLISPTATLQLPLSTAPILTVTPRRWFAPADGFTRIFFDITVRDGNGAPLPGRTVGLSSSIGVVAAGGVTDSNGHTLAYVTSSIAGDSDVSASLNVVPCEGYLAPEVKVTFTTPLSTVNLFPNAQAPYMDGDITVGPLPVVVGVPTTIGTKLTNPLTVPITVDVSFGYATAGIGLVFGPLGD
ncbi:MAG: Ig-like domain-containing protein, partial [Anaerolineales bacterium]